VARCITDLGWMRIDIAPSAQVTKFGLLVGLPGPQQHNHEAVLFFDNYNHLLGGPVCHAVVGFGSLLSKILRDLLVA
jgi:hypothetical protein